MRVRLTLSSSPNKLPSSPVIYRVRRRLGLPSEPGARREQHRHRGLFLSPEADRPPRAEECLGSDHAGWVLIIPNYLGRFSWMVG